MQKCTVFVAGGTGFLGKAVIRQLNKRKFPVVTTSLSQGVDFRNFDQTLAYFNHHRPAVVIDTAAFVGGIKYGLDRAGEMYYNNILMSANLIEAARLAAVKKFINPISSCAYPAVQDKKYTEKEFWQGPLHESVLAYGITRKAAWVQTWAYQQQYGMQFANLVLPNMYGPGDYYDPQKSHALSAILMKIARAKAKNAPTVVIWGTGKPVREWLYVDDGAEALVRAIDTETGIDPINIGIGKGISIAQLARLIKKIVGYNGQLVFDQSKPDGAPYKVMDSARCQQVFGWLPSTDLAAGIKQTYQDYTQRQQL